MNGPGKGSQGDDKSKEIFWLPATVNRPRNPLFSHYNKHISSKEIFPSTLVLILTRTRNNRQRRRIFRPKTSVCLYPWNISGIILLGWSQTENLKLCTEIWEKHFKKCINCWVKLQKKMLHSKTQLFSLKNWF